VWTDSRYCDIVALLSLAVSMPPHPHDEWPPATRQIARHSRRPHAE
jgi:hypothetical protein